MFIKELTGTNKKYLYLARTIREKEKVRHENLVSFGAIDELNEKEIKKIALKLLSYCTSCEEAVPLSLIQEDCRQNWGAMAITKKLLEFFGIHSLIDKLLDGRKIKIDALNIINFLISERLANPKSKYASYKNQHWYIQNKTIDLQNIYRTLDFLAENIDPIKQHLFITQKNIFKLDISVVFYDVTTLYFESKNEDSLKKFGYSKDCKFGDVQVVAGALIDKTGRPLDYEIFSGNTYEGSTLTDFINRIKSKFNISEVIVVCDRGINSGENLTKILDAGEGFNFIVGHRVRSGKANIRNEVLSDDNYIDISKNKDEILKYKIIEIERDVVTKNNEKKKIKDQIVATYSSKRARKDRADRERLIEKAKDIVANSSSINNKRGAKKYINANIDSVELNEKKIIDDSKWDGYYSIEFSKKSLTANEVLDAYHSLWRIENLFRTLKTQLEARPIFHWTPNRIQGHFCLCFIALVLERTIEIECQKKFRETSPTSIREAINSLQVSKVSAENKSYYIFSKISEYAQTILDIVKLKTPPPVLSSEKFTKYLP
ncbi:MAG: IS1634 family transposase [Oligoflexia bacterium]|nr:IS1634 family transposase [Oligoflexia bacterium]